MSIFLIRNLPKFVFLSGMLDFSQMPEQIKQTRFENGLVVLTDLINATDRFIALN